MSTIFVQILRDSQELGSRGIYSRELGRVWSASVLRPTFQIVIGYAKDLLLRGPQVCCPRLLQTPPVLIALSVQSPLTPLSPSSAWPLLLSGICRVSQSKIISNAIELESNCTWILLRSLLANTEKRVSPTSWRPTDCDQLRRRRWGRDGIKGPLPSHAFTTPYCDLWPMGSECFLRIRTDRRFKQSSVPPLAHPCAKATRTL